MSRLNLSDNKIADALKEVRKRGSKIKWCLFGLPDRGTKCELYETGDDHEELVAEMVEEGASKICFAYIKWQVGSTGSFKYVLLTYVSNGVKMAQKRQMITFNRDLDSFMKGRVHVKIDARNEEDLEEDHIDKKVKKAAGTLFVGRKKMVKGSYGKDWVKKETKQISKAYVGTHGRDWKAAQNKQANKAYVGTHGRDWKAAQNVQANKAFTGSHGRDWKASQNVQANKAFTGTHGRDWETRKNVQANKAFSGSHGQEWQTKKNVSKNQAFSGSHGEEWETQNNPQVSQAFSGEHGEEWQGEEEDGGYDPDAQQEEGGYDPDAQEEEPAEEEYQEEAQEDYQEEEQPAEEEYQEEAQEDYQEEEQPAEEEYQEEEQPQEEEKGGGGGGEKAAQVMFDFEGSDDEELPVKEGETVYVLKDVGEWLYVRNEGGSEGYIPTTYAEIQ